MLRFLFLGLACLTLVTFFCAGCAKKPPEPALPEPTSPSEPEETAGNSPDPTPAGEAPTPAPLPALDGAWEPKGYVGPRVEVSGSELVRLWQNAPVLTTTFTMEEKDGRFLLILGDNGLRHTPSGEPYATIRECRFEDGALVFVDDFPYSGESIETLYPTTNSRYGNVTPADETMLPLLEGEWIDPDSDLLLLFRGNVLSYGYRDLPLDETEILTVRHNDSGEIRIVNADPAREEVGMFGPMTWADGVIRTYIPITDVPPAELVFIRAGGSD